MPDVGAGRDVLLEIDLQGARQVASLRPDATLVLLLPPSPDVQADRLRAGVTTRPTWPGGWPRGRRRSVRGA